MGIVVASYSQERLHVALASAQIAVLTWVCWAVGVFSGENAMQARQFPGHLGPSAFLMAIGVASLVGDWHWRRRCAFEGRLSVTAAVAYVGGEFLQAVLTKGRSLSFYVKHGLHSWMAAVVGCCGLVFLEASKLDNVAGPRFKAMPHVCFAAAWCFFIYEHAQPNDFGVRMHWAATFWVFVGGFLRLRRDAGVVERNDDVKESGCAYVVAAYTFFGGQLGLTRAAADARANVGSYVLLWHCLPVFVIFLYVRLFVTANSSTAADDDLEAADHRNHHDQRSRLLGTSANGSASDLDKHG
mmetsp:Transcript_13618/g.41129  ORF Transcript_13618/g.41129 Transcript_13618/m.41129 type:complete len:298 (+) Transcript_13618:43-936(+)